MPPLRQVLFLYDRYAFPAHAHQYVHVGDDPDDFILEILEAPGMEDEAISVFFYVRSCPVRIAADYRQSI